MSGHNHEHGEEVSKRLLGQATLVNGIIGVAEIVAGTLSGSSVLQADAVHNAVDTSMYGLKWRLSGKENPEKVRRYRKWIMSAICLGSLAVGAKATYELATEQYDEPPAAAVGVAVAAGAANITVAKRLHATRHGAEGVHHDGLRHAASDAFSSIVTISSATLAYKGYEVADPLGALVTTGITVSMNFPTTNRLGSEANFDEPLCEDQ
ncbi:hypothetical protein KDA00_02685 [Candidatus Saccharibacteria bacterium]|nr:hypothetical protein [Candidatus Saccharibacteria bacterium]